MSELQQHRLVLERLLRDVGTDYFDVGESLIVFTFPKEPTKEEMSEVKTLMSDVLSNVGFEECFTLTVQEPPTSQILTSDGNTELRKADGVVGVGIRRIK